MATIIITETGVENKDNDELLNTALMSHQILRTQPTRSNGRPPVRRISFLILASTDLPYSHHGDDRIPHAVRNTFELCLLCIYLFDVIQHT